MKKEVLEIEEPKINMKLLSQTGGSIFGLVLALIGVILCLTIIGILPGIGAILIGLVIAVMSVPKVEVDCPSCGLVAKAQLKAKNVKCESCEEVTPLKWLKPAK